MIESKHRITGTTPAVLVEAIARQCDAAVAGGGTFAVSTTRCSTGDETVVSVFSPEPTPPELLATDAVRLAISKVLDACSADTGAPRALRRLRRMLDLDP